MATLLSTSTSNTTGTAADYAEPTVIVAKGTFGGACLVIEASDDGGTIYQPVRLLYGPEQFLLDLGSGTFKFRARLKDASAATSVAATFGGSA